MSRVSGQLANVTACCWVLAVGSSTDALAASPEQKLKRLCGPACVVFCARWLGVQTDTMAGAELAEATDEGTSLGGLAEAATALGLEAEWECCLHQKGFRLLFHDLLKNPRHGC